MAAQQPGSMPEARKRQFLTTGNLIWHGYPIAVHITDTAPGLGVDTPEDLERARKLFA